MTDFDLYVDIKDQLVLFAKAPFRWERAELTRLIADGHRTLYFSSSDQPKYDAYRALLKAVVPPVGQATPAGRVLQLTDVAAELTRTLFHYPLNSTALKIGEDIASEMVQCIKADPSCVKALGALASHDDYTYYHSGRVAAYALAVALHMSASNDEHLRQMALGCVLHDVGKSRIDLKVLHKMGPLTPQEWQHMREHPVFGHEIVQPSVLNSVSRDIILHHHERMDGGGYPHALSEHEIMQEVRIASLADVFDALTTSRPYQLSRTRFEALDLIKHRLIKQIDAEAFKALISLLGDEAIPK